MQHEPKKQDTKLFFRSLSDGLGKTENDFVNRPVKISVVERKPFFMRRSSVNHRLQSFISQDAKISSDSDGGGQYFGFVVDVIARLALEVPCFQFEWLVEDTSRRRRRGTGTSGRRSADYAPVRRVLAEEADIGFVGLLPGEHDDIRLVTSQAVLVTSLALLTSPRRSHLTPSDVVDDVAVTPGVVAGSCVERLLRRSKGRPLLRKLWRRISGRTKHNRRKGSGTRSSWSRVKTLDVGVRRLINTTTSDDDDDGVDSNDFVLIVESTDAAYVTSRRPGCTLSVARHNTPAAEYRFIASNTTTSWQLGLLQRLDTALTALQQASVIKHLYYKWWTSTDCLLSHFTDPDIWRSSSSSDAVDIDETSDDERIFLRSPLSVSATDNSNSNNNNNNITFVERHSAVASNAVLRQPDRTTTDQPRFSDDDDDDDDDGLDQDEMVTLSMLKRNFISRRPGRNRNSVIMTTTVSEPATAANNPVSITTTSVAVSENATKHSRRTTQSNVAQTLADVSSTSATTTAITSASPPSPTSTATTTTTATTTMKLPGRSQRKFDADDDDIRTYDDDLRAMTASAADQDRFDWVFVQQDDVDHLPCDDHDCDSSDEGLLQISEQEAVKERWHLVDEVGQSTSTMTTSKPSSTSKPWGNVSQLAAVTQRSDRMSDGRRRNVFGSNTNTMMDNVTSNTTEPGCLKTVKSTMLVNLNGSFSGGALAGPPSLRLQLVTVIIIVVFNVTYR